jgi:uncharacterized repeat protein (TIGR01451 family)
MTQPSGRKRLSRRIRLAATVLLAGIGTLVVSTPAYAATFPINEPFRSATTNNPNWRLIPDADGWPKLTNEGDGWLQLTGAELGQSPGSAVLDDPFPTNLGIAVEFDYATFGGIELGGKRGDGFSFFLMDGSQPAGVGISGGGLGYTFLPGGYVGIGFDEFGNFSADINGPGQQPDKIAIRGAEDNSVAGYTFLTNADPPGGTVETGNRTGARRVRISITPDGSGGLFLNLASTSGPGTPFEPVITDFNLVAAGQPALPPTFKIGFSGSTGGATNFHEIRDLTVNVPTDLRITKSATTVVHPRQQLSYTLTATNSYLNPDTGVVVHDDVPAGITDVTWTCSPGANGGTCQTPSGSGNAVNAVLDLPGSGASAIVTVQGTASDAVADSVVDNTAEVIPPPDRLDLDGTNNSATAATTVLPFADLAVTKTTSTAAPVLFGATMSYLLGISNNGPGDADGVQLNDPVPAALDPTTVQAPGCTVAAAVLRCPVGALAAGESAEFTVTGQVLGSEQACVREGVVNTAGFTSVSADNVPDNDTATVTTPCQVPVDLSVTKTAPATVMLGDRFSYHITVANSGPFAAPDVVVHDEVPTLVTDVTWECSISDGSACGVPAGTGNTVHTVVTVPSGGSATIVVTGTAAELGAVGNTVISQACPACLNPGGRDVTATAGLRIVPRTLPATSVPFKRIADVGLLCLLVGAVLVASSGRLLRLNG